MIKLVTIDFWDTLFHYPMNEEIFNKRVDFSYNLLKPYSITFDKVKKTIGSLYPYFQKIWDEDRRTPSTEEMIRFGLVDQLNLDLSDEELEKHITFNEELILKERVKIIDGAKEALTYLASKYQLAIISDTGFEPGAILRTILDQYQLSSLIDHYLFSNEVNCSKPDKRIFELAASYGEVKPDEIIHIGDREDKDIVGINRFGGRSIIFGGARDDDYENSKADYKILKWDQIRDIL